MTRYGGNELHHRVFYLRVLSQLWLVPAAAIVCAFLFGVAYTIYVTAFTGQRQYRETAKYYVHYAFNENTQAAYDNYNAYTWDDILYAHPAIRNAIEAGLPEGMTMEEAQEDTEALVLSDIRVLTIEVTAATPEQARGLSAAIRGGLSSFGEVMEEFESIEFLSSDEPMLVVVSDRTNNAVILGVVLGALTALLWILIRESASDAVYAPEDLAALTGRMDVLGFTLRQSGETVYGEDLLPYNLQRVLRNAAPGNADGGKGPFAVFSPLGLDAAVHAAEQLPGDYVPADLPDVPGHTCGALIAVPYGVRGAAARTNRILCQLQSEEYPVYGLILVDCDRRFLMAYYGTRL